MVNSELLHLKKNFALFFFHGLFRVDLPILNMMIFSKSRTVKTFTGYHGVELIVETRCT